jgi:hypothetical protein
MRRRMISRVVIVRSFSSGGRVGHRTPTPADLSAYGDET